MTDTSHLIPFAPEHAPLVAGWPTSATEVRLWCSGDVHPFPARQLLDWDGERYVLIMDHRPVGYGELWADGQETELARLIVDPAVRGRGVGRELVRRLADIALDRRPDVYLRVHPANGPALRCYRSAGFRDVAPALAAEWNLGQPVDYVWFEHDQTR